MSEEDTLVLEVSYCSSEEEYGESGDSSGEEEEPRYFIYMTDSCGDNSHTTSENDGGEYNTLSEAISAAENLKYDMYEISIFRVEDGKEVWYWIRGNDEQERINELEEQLVDLKQKLEEANKEIAALKNNNQ
jgi:hypothetical protein